MTTPTITLASAAALALVFLALSIEVGRQRGAAKISLGDGGTRAIGLGEEPNAPALFVAVRAHANFAEYVPLSLVLLLALELCAAPRGLLLPLAGTLVLGRVLHPFGMNRPSPNPFRAGGIVMQWLFLLAGALYGMWMAVQGA